MDKNNNLAIYNMTNEDIARVLEIQKNQNIMILNENILKEDLKNVSNNHYLVLKLNDKIIGFLCLSYVLDSADIVAIAIDKNFQRQGLASFLIEDAFKFCSKNNISSIMLEVRKSNIPAQNLYLKHGFKKISERKKYYDNTEDAYIFKKEL